MPINPIIENPDALERAAHEADAAGDSAHAKELRARALRARRRAREAAAGVMVGWHFENYS